MPGTSFIFAARVALSLFLISQALACPLSQEGADELGELQDSGLQDPEDEVALLQGNVAVHAKSVVAAAAQQHIITVPLWKQYVPITRNEKVIAYKTSYFGEIQVGSPERQTFTVVFDTGSGHLILPSSRCNSDTCSKHRRYNSSVSETAQDIEHDGTPIKPGATTRDQLAISFGTGEVTGEFVFDKVCLHRDLAACADIRIVLANKMTEEPFGLFEFDGVLGLGLGGLVLNRKFSMFGELVQQHPAMQPHFSVFLARDDAGRSAISFGGHQESWAASKIEWENVAMPTLGYWQVQIKKVRLGDQELEDCATGECRAILDTGTSLLGVPRQVSRTMHRTLARPVPGEHDDHARMDVDCRVVQGSPIQFELPGGLVISLGPEDYSRPQPFNMTVPAAQDGWDLFCRSLLLPVDMKPPLGPLVFIWGEPVLRRYLTVYDWDKERIGFSLAGHNGDAESSGAADTARPHAEAGRGSKDSAGGAIGSPPPHSRAAGAPLPRQVATAPASGAPAAGTVVTA